MIIENVIYNAAAGSTIFAGVGAMKPDEFDPKYLFFHLILIIATAMTVGFFAVTRYKNYMKNKNIKNDRLGKRHF